jgi:membrane protein YdbS with pleckstrin-like domain
MEINQTINQWALQTLVFKTHKSPALLFFKFLFLLLILDIIFIIILYFADVLNIWILTDIKLWAIVLLMLFYCTFFIYWFLSWSLDNFTIKEWKIIHKRGILIKRINIYSIIDINSVRLKQSFLWRMCWYSNIGINYNDREIIFRFVDYPEEFIKMIDLFKNQTS